MAWLWLGEDAMKYMYLYVNFAMVSNVRTKSWDWSNIRNSNLFYVYFDLWMQAHENMDQKTRKKWMQTSYKNIWNAVILYSAF